MAKVMLVTNPAKRKKRTKKRKTTVSKVAAPRRITRRKKTSIKRVSSRRRRNPIKKDIIGKTLMPAAVGAGGALAVDYLYDMVPIPAEYKSGPLQHVAKGGFTIVAGMLAEKLKFIKPQLVKDSVNGSLTVTIHGALSELLGNVSVNGMGYINAGAPAGSALDLVNQGPLSAYELPYMTPTENGLAAYTGVEAWDQF